MADGLSAVVAPKMVFNDQIRNLRRTTDHWGWVNGMYLAKNDK